MHPSKQVRRVAGKFYDLKYYFQTNLAQKHHFDFHLDFIDSFIQLWVALIAHLIFVETKRFLLTSN